MSQLSGYHRVTVLYHPGSGFGRARRRAGQLRDRLPAGRHRLRLVDASRTPPEQVSAWLRASDAVVVVGGDGLLHRVLPSLVDLGIPLGIIPAGSGNDAWRMSGADTVARSQDRIASFLAGQGRIRSCDLLEVEYESEPGVTRYVIGAVSCGFEAQVNARANALPRWVGTLRYPLGAVFSIPALRGHPLEVSAPQAHFRGRVLLASFSNIRTIGGGIPLFPEARDDDGQADLVLVRAAPLHRVLRHLPRVLRGLGHPHRFAARLPWAVVRCAGTSYGDGEPLGTGNFTLTVRPGCLALMDLRPAGTR